MADFKTGTQELEYLLRQIGHLINHYTRSYLSERNLTMARFWVLSNLYTMQPSTMGDLQKRVLLAPGTVTGLVDGLVEEGLVERWREEKDRRLVFLKLTPEGERALADILRFRASVLEKALSGLNDIDLGRLNSALNSLLNSLRNQCPYIPSGGRLPTGPYGGHSYGDKNSDQ